MAAKTFYLLGTTAPSPNYFGVMQDGGTAPISATSTALGWNPSSTSLVTPYYASHCGASNSYVPSTASASSLIDATSGPTKGTGSTYLTAGDSFITPSPLIGNFANTAWTLNFNFQFYNNTGAVGCVRCRVWASVNADGSSARQLTSGTLVCSIINFVDPSTTYNSTVSWSPGTITLTNEYLFFQVEWQETTVGASACGVELYTGSADVVTPVWTPLPSTLTASALLDTAPTLGTSALIKILVGAALLDSPPNLGGTLAEYVLPPAALLDSAPTIGGATFTQKDVLVGGFADSAPTLGTSALSEILVGAALLDTAPPIPTPTIIRALPLANFLDSAPTLGAQTLYQHYMLAAAALQDGAPTPGTSALIEVSVAAGLLDSAPVLGTPEGGYNLSTANLTAAIPTFGQPILFQYLEPPSVNLNLTTNNPTLQQGIFSNFNDAMTMFMTGPSLAGRSDGIRGPAQAITVLWPLKLVNGQLSIDVEAFNRPELQVWAAMQAPIFDTPSIRQVFLPMTLFDNAPTLEHPHLT